MVIHFFIFEWREPTLSKQSGLELGGKIQRLGKDHFLWQFRKWVGINPYVPPSPNAVVTALDLEQGPPLPRLDDFISIARCVVHKVEWLILLGYLIFSVRAARDIGDWRAFYLMLVIGLCFWGLWVGSLFYGFRKYHRWLDRLQAEYSANA